MPSSKKPNSGCVKSIESFLMYVSHDLSAVQYGIHTLDNVQRTLVPLQGPPSALPEFSDDDWYNYVSFIIPP